MKIQFYESDFGTREYKEASRFWWFNPRNWIAYIRLRRQLKAAWRGARERPTFSTIEREELSTFAGFATDTEIPDNPFRPR